MSGWRKRQIAELMEEVHTDTSGRWVSIDEVERLLEKCLDDPNVPELPENGSTIIDYNRL
jgi:hypothetical protein